MEDGKRRAFIKQQAAARKKQEGSLPPKGTSSANSSTKRKPSNKTNCLPKKPKVAVALAVGESPDSNKLPPPSGPGKVKGLMNGHGLVTEKRPILLCEELAVCTQATFVHHKK